MAQDRSTVHDVVIIGSGAGADRTKVLAASASACSSGSGPMLTMSDFDAGQPAGRVEPRAATRRRSTRPVRGPAAEHRHSPSTQCDRRAYTVAAGSQFGGRDRGPRRAHQPHGA